MIDYKQLRENIEFLTPYEQADGTEWGEMINCLCQLAGKLDYLSRGLADQLTKEIADNVEYVKANARIVQDVDTYYRTTSYVEWDDR